jgi:hypothetical protein
VKVAVRQTEQGLVVERLAPLGGAR